MKRQSAGLRPAVWALLFCPLTALPLAEDADKPIHITGQSAELDRDAQKLVYQGNVTVDQGTLRVIADTMVVEYEADRVVRIIATGSPARYQQLLEGDQGKVDADASQIVYHTQAETIDLKGRAHLTQRGRELKGELIRYDMLAGKVDAPSDDTGPVRMILQPAQDSH